MNRLALVSLVRKDLLEFMTDRVELIWPIERHDADFVVNVVKD